MRINSNLMSVNAHRNLSQTQNALGKNLEKLSSGLRINRAGDDAAGLVISENLRSQVGGLAVAGRNVQDGISLVQTAEGALNEMHGMLQRMRDLAVQASNTGANGGSGGASVAAAQAEVDQLHDAMQQINATTQFNGANVLDAGTFTFQVGANGGETLSVSVSTFMDVNFLGTGANELISDLKSGGVADVDSSATAASDAIGIIDDAIAQVSAQRATFGATQNRLEHTLNNLQVASENLAASESRIRDVDMAQEMTAFTRNQILSQAGTAMLSQANAVPQGVLSLLG